MGLFDFLRRLFGGLPQHPYAPPRSQAPAPQSSWPATPQAGRPTHRQPERRETRLQLDAEQFQPLPEEQVRERAMATQFTSFFQFGRRDRIPSPIDPRTKLIDQAMVGHGLIQPEELVRIHEIGGQM